MISPDELRERLLSMVAATKQRTMTPNTMAPAVGVFDVPEPVQPIQTIGGFIPLADRVPLNRVPTGSSKGAMIDQLIRAIGTKESGNNYRAKNLSDPGGGAWGRYQILKSNIPNWSREALGRQVSFNEFYNNPKIQDSIARFKLNQYLQRYGVLGAARAWNGGPGRVRNPNQNVLNYEAAIRRLLGM